DALGIPLGTTAVPLYADGAFRFSFPQKDGSKLSFWGIGGTSDLTIDVSGTDGDPFTGEFESYGSVDRDQYFDTHMATVGATYSKRLSKMSYAKMGVAASRAKINSVNKKVWRSIDSSDVDNLVYSVDRTEKILDYSYVEDKIHSYYNYTKKFDARRSLKVGVNIDYIMGSYHDSTRIVNGLDNTVYDWEMPWNSEDSYANIQPFLSYKHRLTDALTMTAGATAFHSTINSNSTSLFEPRLGFNYDMDKHNKFFTGAGYHTQMQSSYLYYYEGSQALDDSTVLGTTYNKEMGLTKSAHAVAGWEHNFEYPIRLKLEAYYQYLWNIPVEQQASYFSLVNGGSGFGRLWAEPLENRGLGRNYGLEFTMEHYYRNGFYGLLTGSIFDAKYKGSQNLDALPGSADDVWVNTLFNGRYAMNLVLARNIPVGDYGILNLGTKVSTIGGRWFGTVDELKSTEMSEIEYINDATFNTEQYNAYFRLDLKVGYKWNYAKLSHEFALDISNITNNKNILTLTYIPERDEGDRVQENYQLGLFPVFYYKVDF
ncbi:MAG: TonB-dependent receptor, partial [Schleiferiaceae bacterium]|nr:TonB-dependent receptor [Schleiferiaceae bacterium]